MNEDVTNMVSDDEFAAFANNVTKARAQRAQNFSGSGNPKNYENPVFTGLEPGKVKILRVLSTPPSGNGLPSKPGQAVEVHISEIKDDNGKWFRLRLPNREDRPEKDHEIWKMISKITESKWENSTRVPKYKDSHPELYERITKGGWEPGTNQHKYSRGWAGQQKLLVNVIDRHDMEWHKEHKHSKLLAKHISVSENKEGTITEWPDQGVPAYGFIDKLAETASNYGSWLKYDIGVKRTGEKSSPYNIYNASVIAQHKLPEIPMDLHQFVAQGELTEEEKSWETYDLPKLFGPTSYSSILKHLGPSIKEFDAAFKTDYYDTVKMKADKEKEEWKAIRESEQKEEAEKTIPEVVTTPTVEVAPGLEMEATPEVTRAVARQASVASEATSSNLSTDKLAALKGYDLLPTEHQDMITDVILNSDGTVKEVQYTEGTTCVACPTCNINSPMDFTACPSCGVTFINE